MRVVSLVPSSTETLLALGGDVVACSKFCEQPDIPHVGGTKNPDIEAIVALAPDLVVLDREENRIEDHDALVAAGLGRVRLRRDRPVGSPRPWCASWRAASARRCRALSTSCRRQSRATARRTAFVPIWRRPWMTISSAHVRGRRARAPRGRPGSRRRPQSVPDGRTRRDRRRPTGPRRRAERAVRVRRLDTSPN